MVAVRPCPTTNGARPSPLSWLVAREAHGRSAERRVIQSGKARKVIGPRDQTCEFVNALPMDRLSARSTRRGLKAVSGMATSVGRILRGRFPREEKGNLARISGWRIEDASVVRWRGNWSSRSELVLMRRFWQPRQIDADGRLTLTERSGGLLYSPLERARSAQWQVQSLPNAADALARATDPSRPWLGAIADAPVPKLILEASDLRQDCRIHACSDDRRLQVVAGTRVKIANRRYPPAGLMIICCSPQPRSLDGR